MPTPTGALAGVELALWHSAPDVASQTGARRRTPRPRSRRERHAGHDPACPRLAYPALSSRLSLSSLRLYLANAERIPDASAPVSLMLHADGKVVPRCSRPSLATPRRPKSRVYVPCPRRSSRVGHHNKGNAISTKTAQKTVWLRPKRVQTRRMQPTQRTRRIFDGGDAEHRMLVRVASRSPSALANRDHPTRMLPTPDRIWSVHGHVRSAGRRRGVCRPRSTCCTCSAVHVL